MFLRSLFSKKASGNRYYSNFKCWLKLSIHLLLVYSNRRFIAIVGRIACKTRIQMDQIHRQITELENFTVVFFFFFTLETNVYNLTLHIQGTQLTLELCKIVCDMVHIVYHIHHNMTKWEKNTKKAFDVPEYWKESARKKFNAYFVPLSSFFHD